MNQGFGPFLVARAVLRHGLSSLNDIASGWSHPSLWRSLRRSEALRNRHLGQRCFVLGNGPSLRTTDLSRLSNEVIIGTNRIYLLFDELGFTTTYYVSVNRLVIEQCADEIAALPMPKFLSWECRDVAHFTSNTVFLRRASGPAFFTDVSQGYWEGATVTYAALQLAFHLGFREVVLLGVDHSFKTKGRPHEEVVSSGDDPDHFDPSYFGSGFRWQLPDLETSELAYRIADYVYRESGRRVIDATVGGQLRVFPRVDFDTLEI
jgi:hypothetical protein